MLLVSQEYQVIKGLPEVLDQMDHLDQLVLLEIVVPLVHQEALDLLVNLEHQDLLDRLVH